MTAISKCQHCGNVHETTCPRIQAIEYYPDGQIKRVEFHSGPALVSGSGMSNQRIVNVPTVWPIGQNQANCLHQGLGTNNHHNAESRLGDIVRSIEYGNSGKPSN